MLEDGFRHLKALNGNLQDGAGIEFISGFAKGVDGVPLPKVECVELRRMWKVSQGKSGPMTFCGVSLL